MVYCQQEKGADVLGVVSLIDKFTSNAVKVETELQSNVSPFPQLKAFHRRLPTHGSH